MKGKADIEQLRAEYVSLLHEMAINLIRRSEIIQRDFPCPEPAPHGERLLRNLELKIASPMNRMQLIERRAHGKLGRPESGTIRDVIRIQTLIVTAQVPPATASSAGIPCMRGKPLWTALGSRGRAATLPTGCAWARWPPAFGRQPEQLPLILSQVSYNNPVRIPPVQKQPSGSFTIGSDSSELSRKIPLTCRKPGQMPVCQNLSAGKHAQLKLLSCATDHKAGPRVKRGVSRARTCSLNAAFA